MLPRARVVFSVAIPTLALVAIASCSSGGDGGSAREAGNEASSDGGPEETSDAQDASAGDQDAPAGDHDASAGDWGAQDAGAPRDASTDVRETGADARATDAMDTGADASAPDGSVTCSGAMPSLRTDVYPILAGCGAELCHGGTATGPWGGAAGAHGQLVNAPEVRDGCDAGVLVTPGDVRKSYLINKLTGVGMCPGSTRMPRLGSPLPPQEIQTITDWICSGAPNN